jgi:Ca2+-transporting ATPase
LQNTGTFEDSQKKGLTGPQAAEKKKRFGPNEFPEKKTRTALDIYVSQFKDPLIYIISIAAIISIALHEYNDAVIIAVVILLDSLLGFFQGYRAEKTVATLRRLIKPVARVYRDGKIAEMHATEIVPGDFVAINDGDRIPADGDLVESVGLNVNEAILTGESEPVVKGTNDPVYMGTTVLSGRGLVNVTSTGKSTELGKIAQSLSEMKDEPTPLQVKLHSFGKSLIYIVVAVAVAMFVIGTLSGQELLQTLRTTVVLAVAAIPVGLPIAVTMILIIGMRAILRRKGLVKELLAAETLGSVTVICTDKTGTLTEGIMQVVRTDFSSETVGLHVMALCNNLADPLEVTLWNKVREKGIDPHDLSEKCKRTHEVPFSSEKKYMLTVNYIDGKEVAFLKGAPEVVLEPCSIESCEKQRIIKELEEWSSSGLKVLALAYKNGGNLRELKDFKWAGLVGIEDPIRSSVKEAIALCRRAGIKVKIVTGDYRGTAVKVAAAIGLDVKWDQILEGKDIEPMTEAEMAKVVDDVVVFCRVAPHHKLKIVSALQMCGEVTAMIGDGVNDAPALKKANIGITVGNASDVAQETAGLILIDSNFRTVVDAVEEGRVIFENIKKVVAYVLSNSFVGIFTLFGAMIMGWPLPLTVPQILWIHLICDGPSDIVLGFEKGEKGIMDEKPKNLKEGLLDNWGTILIFAISIISASLSLLLFWYMWQVYGDIASGRAIVFTVLAIQELIYIFSYRNLRRSVIRSGNFFSNKALFGAVALGFGQQLVALYVPFLSNALEVVPLHLPDWGLVLSVAFTMVLVVEIVKYVTVYGRNRQK